MRRILIAFAVVIAAGSAAASEQTDVMAPVHQFIDATNKGDVKTAVADCAAQAVIIDEFPPHAWQGATACADWASDFEAYNKKNGITDAIATIGKPRHIDITGDRAHVVVPANYSFKQNGKKVTESGSTMTLALQKVAAGWRITGWAWAKH
jgi:hypothetical protein